MSWLSALAMASRSPSAVDSAAARPPAATRPEITYGRPAISGVESTITSVLITKSCSRTTPGWPAIALQAATIASMLAAFLPQIWISPSSPQVNIQGRMLATSLPMMLVYTSSFENAA